MARIMKLPLLMIAFVVQLSCFAADGPADERIIWEQRIQQIQPGMRREEADRLLPRYRAPAMKSGFLLLPYSSVLNMRTGSRQVVRYYVAPGWLVSVCYDYTGSIPGDAEGRAVHMTPDNRVIGDATLEYLPEKPTPAGSSKP